jgi:hypothetical protein
MQAQMSAMSASRQQKKEGDISAVFSSLRPDDPANVFPARFSDLKREMWKDSLAQSWKEVLEELETVTERVVQLGEGVSEACSDNRNEKTEFESR